MDKISGILPSSARVQAVDLKESSPVRPGVPSFGRARGVSPHDSATAASSAKESIERAVVPVDSAADWRKKDAEHAAVAQEVTNRFFAKNDRAPADSVANPSNDKTQMVRAMATSPDSRPAGFKIEDREASPVSRFHPEVSFEDEEGSGMHLPEMFKRTADAPARKQPDGLYPKGSFIDRSA